MAQLLLMGTKLACGLPGSKVVGPLLISLVPVLPINIIAYVTWLLVLKLTNAAWTRKLAPTWKRAALVALGFYFATVIPLYFILLLFLCRAAG